MSLYCNSCQVQREQPSKRWPQTRGHRSTWILSRSQARIHEGLGTQNYFHFTHLIRRRKGSGHYNSGSCCERTCQGEKCNIANPISLFIWMAEAVFSVHNGMCRLKHLTFRLMCRVGSKTRPEMTRNDLRAVHGLV